MVTGENLSVVPTVSRRLTSKDAVLLFKLGVLTRMEILIVPFIISLLLPCLVVNSSVILSLPSRIILFPIKRDMCIFLSPLRELSSLYETGNAVLH